MIATIGGTWGLKSRSLDPGVVWRVKNGKQGRLTQKSTCRNFENCGIENPGSEIRQGRGVLGWGNEERTTKGSSGKPRGNNLEWWNLGFQIRGEFDH